MPFDAACPGGYIRGVSKTQRLLLGPVIACACFFAASLLPYGPDVVALQPKLAAAITGLTAAYWLTNALPLGATSLLPLALMPLFGVLPVGSAAVSYAHPVVWMFFGGFVIALGIERWNLHKRIALNVILRAGASPNRLVFGFMAAAALLSMWLNNTAMTLLLLPIALALIDNMREAGGVTGTSEKNFAFALLVGIAYACSIGGTGTLIGTAPNAVFLANFAPFEDAGAPPITFLTWMLVGVPLVWIFVPIVWFLLTKWLAPMQGGSAEAEDILKAEARALPPRNVAENRMLFLFILAGVLWTTRADVDLGSWGTIPGWWHLFPVESARDIGNAGVAAFVAVLTFLVPSGMKKDEALMDWETAKGMPWDILFLIGGGIAIAEAFRATGLATATGLALQPIVENVHPIMMIFLVCMLMTFLTEVTSNTAMTALLLPVLASTSQAAHVDPRLLMIPATLSASCAFMLPISTPPNAIVFSSGRVPMMRMAKVGLIMNLIGVVIITLLTWFILIPLMGIEPRVLPQWASP